MEIGIEGATLHVSLEGLEKVWALKRGLDIPLEHIVKVSTREPDSMWYDLRLPGTYLPGVIRAGSYYAKRGGAWTWEFWYYTRGKEFLTIDLRDERYGRVILGVDDAVAQASLIGSALSGN